MKIYTGLLVGALALALTGCDDGATPIETTGDYCSRYKKDSSGDDFSGCTRGDIISAKMGTALFCSFSNTITRGGNCVYIGYTRDKIEKKYP